jgi:hypothetical protein
LRLPGWDISGWREQLDAYLHAIAQDGRGVPIAAPDASTGVPQLRWLRAVPVSRMRLLTDHFYPLTSCNYSRPTISELLARATRQSEDAMLARLKAMTHAAGTPLRIDETNNVSCHGEAGVSDSFASALWAVDWIVRAMRAGVSGVNFHDLLDEPAAYSPLVLRRGRLHANPEWYALLMTAPLTGDRPLAETVSGKPGVTAGAFLGGTPRSPRAAVVLVDFDPPGSAPRAVRLRLPTRFRSGSVLRLQAASPSALSHVTLGASEVTPSGAWRPRPPQPALHGERGSFVLQLPAGSAALVSLSPR